MSHLADEESPSEILAAVPAEQSAIERLRVSLNRDSLTRLLREQEVLIQWDACPEGRSFPVNVTEAARPGLPISPGSGRPAEQHLIAYYQGRVTWEDLFPDPSLKDASGIEAQDVQDEEGVDTSQIQSYIVREFVEALKGIRDDLKAASQSSRACMQLALLGAVSPVALARRVVEAAHEGERTPTATGFQLVEILTCLDVARNYDAAPMFRDEWCRLVDDAVSRIAKMLDELQGRYSSDLTRDFRRYARTVRKHHQTGQQ